MSDPTPPRLTCAQVRELDRLAIEELGLPGVVLMENAGAGAARLALSGLEPARARRVEIVCGPGNNGGDGWVVARHLANADCAVHVASCVAIEDLRGDAAIHARVARGMGIEITFLSDGDALARSTERWARADLVVDALLGTGARGAPRGLLGAAIAAIEALPILGRPGPGVSGAGPSGSADRGRPWILALDVPSGLDADSGARAGACVRADDTATFAAEKIGFAAPGAAAWLGRVHVVDLGVPRALFARVRAGN
ncbi:MAG: NAD(P)H-hydrate epimerase [Planctomycetota bacterium]|nr:NAD(P)H-hydrate epimerase [Planctomycetota bacterium]